MYKYTQIFSALIILVSVIEISSISSNTNRNQITKNSKKEISEITTNETLALPTLLNPPDQYPKLISYYNSAKKSISNDFDMNLNKPKNLLMQIFGLSLGYLSMILWTMGMCFCLREPFVTKSSSGLSKDFLLIQTAGWILIMFNDAYGIFGNSSYKNEIHINDIMLSFNMATLFLNGLIVVRMIPGDPINKFSFTTASLCTVSI